MSDAKTSPAKILAVDTCFGACSAAVVQDGRVFAGQFVVMERGHAEALAPMVDAVMKTAGLSFCDLDRLAVTTGPGTFTGQRVGLAFMRALRVALRKPLIGISSLAAMAAQAKSECDAAQAAAVHDAKREEVYIEILDQLRGPQILSVAAAEEFLRPLDNLVLAGTAAHRFAQLLRDAKVSAVVAPDAVWVGRLAATSAMPSGAPRPLYLRAPDARLPAAK